MKRVRDAFTRLQRMGQNGENMDTETMQNDPAGESARVDVEAGSEQENEDATQVEALRAENGQLKDRLARSQAEFDNARKREVKERQDARDYAVQGAVEPFLGVMDNFQ